MRRLIEVINSLSRPILQRLPALVVILRIGKGITDWLGERMDMSMAIDGLIYIRRKGQDITIGKQGRL